MVATSLSATATTFENGMYYVNEGWYGHDNGSITWISDEGDVVADFFCGSGTTLVVAKELGRMYVGCDISDKAIEITKKRLNN